MNSLAGLNGLPANRARRVIAVRDSIAEGSY
jgi:hypothetical protein